MDRTTDREQSPVSDNETKFETALLVEVCPINYEPDDNLATIKIEIGVTCNMLFSPGYFEGYREPSMDDWEPEDIEATLPDGTKLTDEQIGAWGLGDKLTEEFLCQ